MSGKSSCGGGSSYGGDGCCCVGDYRVVIPIPLKCFQESLK